MPVGWDSLEMYVFSYVYHKSFTVLWYSLYENLTHIDISAKRMHYPTMEMRYSCMGNKGIYITRYSATIFSVETRIEQDCGTDLHV